VVPPRLRRASGPPGGSVPRGRGAAQRGD
jgi:hypothetical protein